MMAESLPFSGSLGPLSGRELDAWYEDLQDILFSETKNAGLLQSATDKQGMQVDGQDSSSYLWTVDAVQSLPVSFTEEDVVALEAVVEQLPSEVLEFLNQGSQTNFDISSASSEVLNVPYDIPSEAMELQYIPSETVDVQHGILAEVTDVQYDLPSEGTTVQQDIPSTSPETIDVHDDKVVEVDSSCSSPSQTHTEDEESSGSQSGTKRKRSSQPRGGKVRAKEKEQENEKQVSYLMAENERLKGEIERLSVEVEKTRKALIERMVNLKKV